MSASWRTDTGHLSCRWNEAGTCTPYNPSWMEECGDIRGSYLPPLPDFANHSPFGSPSWFLPSDLRHRFSAHDSLS